MTILTIKIHNLPSQSTPFIGRETEILEIVELIQDKRCRLLTLLGAGGMGKTRLAIESIQQLSSNDFEHGVFYVPLAPLTSADNIVTTVISTLGIILGDAGTPQEELVKFLAGRNLLLVMDNFEHVLEGADLVADILNHAPSVKILVTSREPLNLMEEHLWHVRGMQIPDVLGADDMEQYSGLKLFIDRARRVRHDFDSNANMAQMIEICQIVGGMPLGIELSASWLKSLTCNDILKEIQRNIDFLQTNVRNIPERHRSMRAVFDHSWDLLSSDEQAVFPRLSVFRGGFTREAAEKVADADLMILSGLVEKSMVRRDETGRYDVHELLRQYGAETIKQQSELEEILSRHLSYYSRFLEYIDKDMKGRRQIDGVADLYVERDNIRQAWSHGVDNVDLETLDKMLFGLTTFEKLTHDNFIYELLHLLTNDFLEVNYSKMPEIVNRIQSKKVIFNLEKHLSPQNYEQLKHHMNNARSYDDKYTIAEASFWCADYCFHSERSAGEFEFMPDYLAIALEYYTISGDEFNRARVMFSQAIYLEEVHLYKEALKLSLETLQLRTRINDHYGIAWQHRNLESISRNLGDSDKAIFHITNSLEKWDELGIIIPTLEARLVLAEELFFRGEFDNLKSVMDEIIPHSHLIHAVMPLAMHSLTYSTVDNDYQIGLSIAQQGYEEYLKAPRVYGKATLHFALALASTGCGNFRFAYQHYVEALQMYPLADRTRIVAIALYAIMLAHDEKLESAVETIAVASTLPDNASRWTQKWDLLRNLRMKLKQVLGDLAFQAVWDRGTQRDLEATINELLAYFSDSEYDTPKPVKQSLPEPLTDRELEVLELLAEGLTNPQIAEKLYLSTGTVKVHTRNIYGKLGVSNRTEASTKARDLNLI